MLLNDVLKAPLCKGGWQKSLIFDWGIVVLPQPLRAQSKILPTSPYTGEARATRSKQYDKLKFEKERRYARCVNTSQFRIRHHRR